MDTVNARTEMMAPTSGVVLNRDVTRFSTMLPIKDSVVVEKTTLVLGVPLIGLRLEVDSNGAIVIAIGG